MIDWLNSFNKHNNYQYLNTYYTHRNILFKVERAFPRRCTLVTYHPSGLTVPIPVTFLSLVNSSPTPQLRTLLCTSNISLGLKSTGANLRKPFLLNWKAMELIKSLSFLNVKEVFLKTFPLLFCHSICCFFTL